jgi:uncharacterized membrane protein
MGFRPHDYTIMASAQVPFGKVEFTFIYVSVCHSLDINNFPTMNIFRFVAEEGSCLIYIICICLRIVMSNTIVLCFLHPYVVSFSGLSIFDCPVGIL